MRTLRLTRTAILAAALLASSWQAAAAQELQEIPKAAAQADQGPITPASLQQEQQARLALAEWQARQRERHMRALEQQAAAGGAPAGDVSAQAVSNVLTLLSAKFFPDQSGNTVIVGEAQNHTATSLTFGVVRFNLFTAANAPLGSDEGYLMGSQNGRLALTGSFTSVLPPAAIGFFKISTTIPFASVAVFSFSSEAETFVTFSPRTSLTPGTLTLSPNAQGGTDYTFPVTNAGSDTVAYLAQALVVGYADGTINDVNFSYVNGITVTQCGNTTNTGIASGGVAPIQSSFTRPVTAIARYAFEWDEVGVSPSLFNGTAAAGSGTTNVFTHCPWTATSNSNWIAVTSGASGSADGTVSFSVAANHTPGSRTGSLTIAGITVTVNQTAPLGVLFTDPLLTSGVSQVRAIHIAELRARINALRSRSGLTPFAWTDATLTTGVTVIKAAHIAELRAALLGVYQASARTPPAYTDATLVAGVTPMKAAHVMELRSAVVAIE